MSDTAQNNKRIAKNTLMLYFRMFFIMTISLFTSRIILRVLGVEDFGIYNVVGGIVAMLGVFNSAMTVSTQRFLTYELGRGDNEKLKKNFSMCFTIYAIVSILLFILAETIGLWFLNTKLIIPQDRIVAANWVYQFTIFSSIVSMMTNPYNASIVAHENMNVYAYVSIIDAILKLIIVYLLLVVNQDKLIVYSGLIMLVIIIDFTLYCAFCKKKYPETHYSFYWDPILFKQLISYSGWNIFGSLCGIAKGQGLNILLNMFFNPAINAARGIAFQVNNIVSQFFNNFFTAVRPQITKYYAQNDIENMFNLVFKSSKFSFYLILLISLPILIETPFIINLWLGQIPEYVVPFIRLIIIVTAIDSTANPIMTVAHATGNIKLYQSFVGTIIILNIPISYVLLSYGFSPISVFIVSIILSSISFFVRLWCVKRLIKFSIFKYLKDVCLVVLIVAFVSAIIPTIILFVNKGNSYINIINCIVCLLSTCISIYIIGLTKSERKHITRIIINKVYNGTTCRKK